MIRHLLLAAGLALITGTSAMAGLLRHPPQVLYEPVPTLINQIAGIVDLGADTPSTTPSNNGSANTGTPSDIHSGRSDHPHAPLLGLNDTGGNDPRAPQPSRDSWSF